MSKQSAGKGKKNTKSQNAPSKLRISCHHAGDMQLGQLMPAKTKRSTFIHK